MTTTTTDQLTAILSECNGTPADEIPLLVAADWLDERGDVRGEAISRDILPSGRCRPQTTAAFPSGYWYLLKHRLSYRDARAAAKVV